MPRKDVKKIGARLDETKVLEALTAVHLLGMNQAAKKLKIHRTTLWHYKIDFPELEKQAQDKARELMEQRCARIADLAFNGIEERISDKKGRAKVRFQELLNAYGIAFDKLAGMRKYIVTKHEHEFDESKPLRIIFEDRNGNGSG